MEYSRTDLGKDLDQIMDQTVDLHTYSRPFRGSTVDTFIIIIHLFLFHDCVLPGVKEERQTNPS